MSEPRDPDDGMLNTDDVHGQNLNRENPAESIELRVRRLEDIAFEGDGLTRAVTRLGVNASALGEALITVDRNQQRLTSLGLQLEHVQNNGALKAEVAEVEQRTAESITSYRKQVIARVYACAVVFLALIVGAALAATSYRDREQARAYTVCTNRAASINEIVSYYSLIAKKDPDEEVRTAAAVLTTRLAASIAPCGDKP